MSIVARPEECPPMRHVIASDFHQATDVALTFEAQGSARLKSLAVPSAQPQSGSRSASDLIWALWKRKPPSDQDYLLMRRKALLHQSEDVRAILGNLSDTMQGYTLTDENSVALTPLPLRHLRINDGQITADQFSLIAAMVYGHPNLASIALQANLIQPTERNTMKSFALAASLSNLRHIELSNNPIGVRSVQQLLQNLHMPSLTHLYLSMTMRKAQFAAEQESNELWTLDEDQSWRQKDSEQVWADEIGKVTDLIVRLVAPSIDQMPYCPRLTFLTLNGNDLNWRSVKRIVTAVQSGSRNLEEVGLFSTMDDVGGALDRMETEDEEITDEERHNDDEQRGVRRVTSIGTFMYQNARSRNAAPVQDRAHEAITAHEPVPLPQQQANPSVRLITYPMPQQDPAPLKIDRQTWRKCLGNRVWSNRQDKLKVQDASRKLLAVVRTLACQCRHGRRDAERSTDVFPFAKLPPEVRHRIVFNLYDDDTLSNEQVENIISYASHRETIGYGQRSANFGLSTRAIEQIKYETDDGDVTMQYGSKGPGLLLHRVWRWTTMCAKYSVPRDWPATVLDEHPAKLPAPGGGSSSVVRRDEDDFGGGGGPDGQGGSAMEPGAAQMTKAGRDWLNEQPGLQAFWEATGTHAPP